jgi:hypothetical protein
LDSANQLLAGVGRLGSIQLDVLRHVGNRVGGAHQLLADV